MRRARGLNLAGRGLNTIPDDVFMVAQEEGVPSVDLSKNLLQEVPEG